MAAVIGFSGRKKSGKTTISQAVADAVGWQHASFGDFVRHQASLRGLDSSSTVVLQDLGDTLIGEGWPEFCGGLLTLSGWTPGTGLIIDGIRHAEAVQHLATIVAPLRIALVYVTTDDDTLVARRAGRNAQDFAVIESHPTEAEVTTTLPSLADLTVNGGMHLEDVVPIVVKYIESLPQ